MLRKIDSRHKPGMRRFDVVSRIGFIANLKNSDKFDTLWMYVVLPACKHRSMYLGEKEKKSLVTTRMMECMASDWHLKKAS